MTHIHISYEFQWPLQRQTPNQSGIWRASHFSINQETPHCDWWVVIENLRGAETTYCPPGRKILCTGEPPSIKVYHPDFLKQFDIIFSPHSLKHIPGVTWHRLQLGLPWMVGGQFDEQQQNWQFSLLVRDYDDLKQMAPPSKTRKLSAIVSTKSFSRGHRNRLKFIQKLKKDFGERLDLYGNGIRSVRDKWEALQPYAYSVIIENYETPGYFTEKLLDSYLSYTYPIYCGAPDIFDYFSENSLSVFSIHRYRKARELIQYLLESDTYTHSVPALTQARELVLDYYNMFAYLDRYCTGEQNQSAPGPLQKYTLHPQNRFPKVHRWTPKFLR